MYSMLIAILLHDPLQHAVLSWPENKEVFFCPVFPVKCLPQGFHLEGGLAGKEKKKNKFQKCLCFGLIAGDDWTGPVTHVSI